MKILILSIFVGSFLMLSSCKNDASKSTQLPVNSKKEFRELMINSHKAYLDKESKKLDEYTASTPYDFVKTGSGLRYSIYESAGSTDSIQKGDIALINYTLTLLNGDTAYRSLKGKPEEFIVALDDVEAGLHEGIQKLAIGDKAIFVLPAHLAHGISGDNAAIPPQSPLVYNVELIGKR